MCSSDLSAIRARRSAELVAVHAQLQRTGRSTYVKQFLTAGKCVEHVCRAAVPLQLNRQFIFVQQPFTAEFEPDFEQAIHRCFIHGLCTSLQVPSVSAVTPTKFLSSRAAIALKSTALARILCPGARFGILFAANGYTADPNLL